MGADHARQGFWNGAAAPYGYCIAAAEQRGAKTKKRLAIDPVEAEVVRLMFRLAHEGDGTGGPMGVGGRTTLMGIAADSLSRLPSSYFVTVAFMSWMLRRRGVLLGPEGGLDRWLY